MFVDTRACCLDLKHGFDIIRTYTPAVAASTSAAYKEWAVKKQKLLESAKQPLASPYLISRSFKSTGVRADVSLTRAFAAILRDISS